MLAMFIYNNTVHSFIEMTLMKTLIKIHGDLRINVDVDLPESSAPHAKKRVEMLNKMHTRLQKALASAMTAQKKQYDKRHQSMSFRIEDKVMLSAKNLQLLQSCHKLNHK